MKSHPCAIQAMGIIAGHSAMSLAADMNDPSHSDALPPPA